jgi:ATP-dependent helicase HrpA
MRVAITDHQGRQLRAGRDPGLLAGEGPPAPPPSSDAWERARNRWERDGVTRWDFGALPREVPLEADLVAFPALEPAEEGARVRLLPSAAEADAVHPKGVAGLLAARLSRDLKFAARVLKLPARLSDAAVYFGGPRRVERAMEKTLVRLNFRKDVRSAEAFEDLARHLASTLVSEANELLDRVLPVLEGYARLRSTLHRLETSAAANPAVRAVCDAARTRLAELVPPDFLERCSLEQLTHLPRYLKALEIRAERGSFDPQKDRGKADEVAVFERELREIREGLSPNATQEKREAVEELGRWIDEYRVSVFAPELSTAVKVSPKRLRKKAEEIRRMV